MSLHVQNAGPPLHSNSIYCVMTQQGLEFLSMQGNSLVGQIPTCLLGSGAPHILTCKELCLRHSASG